MVDRQLSSALFRTSRSTCITGARESLALSTLCGLRTAMFIARPERLSPFYWIQTGFRTTLVAITIWMVLRTIIRTSLALVWEPFTATPALPTASLPTTTKLVALSRECLRRLISRLARASVRAHPARSLAIQHTELAQLLLSVLVRSDEAYFADLSSCKWTLV